MKRGVGVNPDSAQGTARKFLARAGQKTQVELATCGDISGDSLNQNINE
jgi:hypothetical protein